MKIFRRALWSLLAAAVLCLPAAADQPMSMETSADLDIIVLPFGDARDVVPVFAYPDDVVTITRDELDGLRLLSSDQLAAAFIERMGEPLLDLEQEVSFWGTVTDSFDVQGMRHVEVSTSDGHSVVVPLSAVAVGTYALPGDRVRVDLRPGGLGLAGIKDGFATFRTNDDRMVELPLAALPDDLFVDHLAMLRVDGTADLFVVLPMEDAVGLLQDASVDVGISLTDMATR